MVQDEAHARLTPRLRAGSRSGVRRKEAPHAVGESRDGWKQSSQQLEGIRFIARLLQELTAGLLFPRLARVNVPGRQLKRDRRRGYPILAHPQDLVMFVDGDDEDGISPLDDLVGLSPFRCRCGQILEPESGEDCFLVLGGTHS